MQEGRHQRVLGDVDGGVGGREGDRDQPPGRHEPQEAEHQHLAPPEREQPLEHRDRTLPVGALLGHSPIHRQRSEQGQEHYEEGGEGREHPGCERRDARDVAEGREVVYPCQAYHLPPRVLLASALLGLRSWHVLDDLCEQPALESAGRGFRRGLRTSTLRLPRSPATTTGTRPARSPFGHPTYLLLRACGVSCRVRAERVKPYASLGRLAGDSPRGPTESPCGSPAPRRHPGLGVFLASYCHPAVYASRARLSTFSTGLFTGVPGETVRKGPRVVCGPLFSCYSALK